MKRKKYKTLYEKLLKKYDKSSRSVRWYKARLANVEKTLSKIIQRRDERIVVLHRMITNKQEEIDRLKMDLLKYSQPEAITDRMIEIDKKNKALGLTSYFS